MPFKTITIKKSTYDLLLRHKRKKESFSAMFERTYEEREPDLSEFFGCLKLSGKEVADVKGRMRAFKRSVDKDARRRERHVLHRLRSAD